MNKLIHGDFLEVMKQFPDNLFDLCLTDPPYGINVAKTGKVGGEKLAAVTDYGKKEWDSFIPNKEYFDEMRRVSKNQIIFGGNYFIEFLSNSSCWIVWDKNNTGNFADAELAWTSFITAVRIIKWTWNGMLQQDMRFKEKRIHPTQKPVGVFKWILKNYSKENDKIIDPFSGSGVTAVTCLDTNREYYCVEKDYDYYLSSEERIKNHVIQEELF